MTGSIKILFCYFIYIFSIFIVRSILSFYWFDLQYTPKNLYNSIMKEEAFLNVVKLFSELLSDTFYFSVTERVYYFREQSNSQETRLVEFINYFCYTENRNVMKRMMDKIGEKSGKRDLEGMEWTAEKRTKIIMRKKNIPR